MSTPLQAEPLKSILLEANGIEDGDHFIKWRSQFISVYETFLDGQESERAITAYKNLSKDLAKLTKTIHKLTSFVASGHLSTERCSVKARQSISELQRSTAEVEAKLLSLCPSTKEDEAKCGYSKFVLGAVLVRDSFSQYRELDDANTEMEILSSGPMKDVADRQVLYKIVHYNSTLNMFCGIMSDLGLYTVMQKCQEFKGFEVKQKDTPKATPNEVETPKAAPKEVKPLTPEPAPQSEEDESDRLAKELKDLTTTKKASPPAASIEEPPVTPKQDHSDKLAQELKDLQRKTPETISHKPSKLRRRSSDLCSKIKTSGSDKFEIQVTPAISRKKVVKMPKAKRLSTDSSSSHSRASLVNFNSYYHGNNQAQDWRIAKSIRSGEKKAPASTRRQSAPSAFVLKVNGESSPEVQKPKEEKKLIPKEQRRLSAPLKASYSKEKESKDLSKKVSRAERRLSAPSKYSRADSSTEQSKSIEPKSSDNEPQDVPSKKSHKEHSSHKKKSKSSHSSPSSIKKKSHHKKKEDCESDDNGSTDKELKSPSRSHKRFHSHSHKKDADETLPDSPFGSKKKKEHKESKTKSPRPEDDRDDSTVSTLECSSMTSEETPSSPGSATSSDYVYSQDQPSVVELPAKVNPDKSAGSSKGREEEEKPSSAAATAEHDSSQPKIGDAGQKQQDLQDPPKIGDADKKQDSKSEQDGSSTAAKDQRPQSICQPETGDIGEKKDPKRDQDEARRAGEDHSPSESSQPKTGDAGDNQAESPSDSSQPKTGDAGCKEEDHKAQAKDGPRATTENQSSRNKCDPKTGDAGEEQGDSAKNSQPKSGDAGKKQENPKNQAEDESGAATKDQSSLNSSEPKSGNAGEKQKSKCPEEDSKAPSQDDSPANSSEPKTCKTDEKQEDDSGTATQEPSESFEEKPKGKAEDDHSSNENKSSQGGSSDILPKLRQLDTASLCDADMSMQMGDQAARYKPLKLMHGLRPLNHGRTVMAGVARTIQCTEHNDFLAVLDGLCQAQRDDVLIVDTSDSSKAVAGEIFCAEAARMGVAGILVDGAMRESAFLQDYSTQVRCWSKTVSPYTGTVNHLGTHQIPLVCGGVEVKPGQIVVGDDDGIVVADRSTFEAILPIASGIKAKEQNIKGGLRQGMDLHSMNKFKEHLETIRQGKASTLLQFVV